MPWLTYRYDERGNDMHSKLKARFDIKGVPMVFVLEPTTGFLISKKGRKDICDLSVSCLKNWSEEIQDQQAKQEKLREGFAIVEEIRKKQEEEERKKKELEDQ